MDKNAEDTRTSQTTHVSNFNQFENALLIHQAKAPSSAVLAAFGTCELFDARMQRETELIVRSAVGGAIKEAQIDPCGTAIKAATAVGVGAVLGVAATAASPWIAGGAIALGAAGTGAWLWSTFNTSDAHNRERNNAVARAVHETWQSGDRNVLERNVQLLETRIGKDSLDLGLGLVSGGSASRAARIVPGFVCRELPSLGFKFFGQASIAQAFPARIREFELMDNSHPLTVMPSTPMQVAVKEILGHDRLSAPIKGPEQSLLIAHRQGADNTLHSLPPSDLVAICHPELLAPLTRARSILQHAANVEMQVDTAAGRLRFLTVDGKQKAPSWETFTFDKRFILGERHTNDMPLADFVHALRMNKLMDSLQWKTREALKHHNLREIETGFDTLPWRVSGIKGAGAESIAFDLAGTNHSPILSAENLAPKDVVLKVSNPKYSTVKESFGLRPFDARRFGEFEIGRRTEYVAYLQEKTEPVNFDEISDAEYLRLSQMLRQEGCVLFDKQGQGQLGYTADGRLVVIDWFAALGEDICARPRDLLDETKPSR